MELTRLGRTNLMVTRTAFGVLPIQRTDLDEAVRILRRAYDAGINFYDTARAYSNSEEKLGRAFEGIRDKVIIATKSMSTTKAGVMENLETSLRNLKTDYVDILQLHNPATLPDPNDPESSYAGLVEARDRGMVRFISITNHSFEVANKAIDSGLFDTLQYPLCSISAPSDLALIDRCKSEDIGLIAMKPLSGGLLTNARSAFAFLHQFDNVVPIWGIQRMSELEEILSLDSNPPALDEEILRSIESDRNALASNFCRACGYCLPCPAEIPIPMAARMFLLLRRMPYAQFMTDEWRMAMHRINDCVDCGHCKSKCPYGLDTPSLLKKALADYDEFYKTHAEA